MSLPEDPNYNDIDLPKIQNVKNHTKTNIF